MRGDAPLTVTLAALFYGGDPPQTVAWSFGDGTPNGSGAVVSHTYQSPGTFAVEGLVQDALGVSQQAQASVLVAPSLSASIHVAAPATGCPVYPLAYNLTAEPAGGMPPDQDAWSLDSGQPTPGSTFVAYRLAGPGGHTVHLWVTDSAGRTATSSVSVDGPALCSVTPPGTEPTQPPAHSVGGAWGTTALWASAAGLVLLGVAFVVIRHLGARKRRGGRLP